jgi:hypothetical protein
LSISDTPANHLNRLVGGDLSSVEFVRDYFQLRFNGPTLNVMTKATLRTARGQFTFPGASFVSELVSLISSRIIQVEQNSKEIVIYFGEGRLSMSLDPNDYDVEALYFFYDDFAAVWN